jgi:hypothetical protein
MEPEREPVKILQPWRCDTCGRAGEVEGLSNEDASTLCPRAFEQHDRLSPDCRGFVRYEAWRVPK